MKKKSKNIKTDDFNMARVLYQRLGKDWYAFTEIDGDCFMTKVSASVAEKGSKENIVQLDDRYHTRKKNKAA